MTGTHSLLARTALGSVVAIACAAAISTRRLFSLPRASFDRLVVSGMVVSRLAVYSLVFFVLRIEPRGDIPGAYTPEGFAAVNGLLVYRDYPSSYAPLHPYLDGAIFHLWPSPRALILFALLAELAILPIWLRAGRQFLSERNVRMSSLLYLLSPLSLQYVTIDGQDNVVVAVLLGLAILLLVRGRALLSGISAGLTIALFKFLPLLYVPSFFLAAERRRWRWLLALLLPVVLVYGTFVLLHAPITVPLTREGSLRKAGNLPFLVETFAGRLLPTRFWDGLVLVVLALILLSVVQTMRNASPAVRLRVLTFSMPAITWALLLFSKKSWPPYLLLTFFPVCLVVSNGPAWKRFVFLLFSLVALVEHSFWSVLLHEPTALEFHHAVFAGRRVALELLLLELLQVLGYVWLLAESVQHIFGARAAALAEPPASTHATFDEGRFTPAGAVSSAV